MTQKNDFITQITKRSQDFSRWYTDVIRRAELADYSPMKGMMVIRPYGYEIWELMKARLDRMFKATGHRNAYFPLFIPESLLKKEAEHVEGFAPEVAWVTMGGNEPLEERYAVRPTSEAIICSMYARWVSSWRDLPLLINQWANVVRWEKVTRPFLRTTEFLWQEGHTVHATAAEAQEETLRILDIYRTFVEEYLALPVIAGLKTDAEKFAGAVNTYCIEALMPDGRALQAGTSHNLGQNFSRAFNIRFENRDQELEFGWGTSWGVSTRLVGAVIMAHGDDSGLIIPPRIAPFQAVIVPISRGNWKETVLPEAIRLRDELQAAGIRAHLDDCDTNTPGWKFAEWEMRGVPVRVEIGPKDIEKKQVVLVNRINREKSFVSRGECVQSLQNKLDEIQSSLFERALKFRDDNTRDAADFDALAEIIQEQRGLVRAGWCGSTACEALVKEKTKATIRVILEEEPEEGVICAACGGPSKHMVLLARSY
ncbi:MAG TPA: proline--tRNA ligase [Candidatus Aminicenantes bacterium]|nr:proline--tRNA ligase [Candidatus Aminicenantes bacterium]